MSSNNAKRESFVSAAIKWGEENSDNLGSLTKHDLGAIADSAGLKFPH